jgi:hypothetical protein
MQKTSLITIIGVNLFELHIIFHEDITFFADNKDIQRFSLISLDIVINGISKLSAGHGLGHQ